MSLNSTISNSGITSETVLTCGSIELLGGIIAPEGILVGSASLSGSVSSFAGKDMFLNSNATTYVSSDLEVKIRGAGEVEAISITAMRSFFSKPIIVSSIAGNYLQFPALTTAQRDALIPAAGMTILNSDTSKLNFYSGAGWEAITSA